MRAIGVSMFEYVCAGACECVCVCLRERERVRETERNTFKILTSFCQHLKDSLDEMFPSFFLGWSFFKPNCHLGTDIVFLLGGLRCLIF